MSQDIRKTPLFDQHLLQGARMIEYADWQLPVQYTGISEEHLAVRKSAGLFDVSHMGEIEITGSAAREFADYLLTRNLRDMAAGKAYYSPMCYLAGGTVDDLIVYPLSDERILLVVNAANCDKDFIHLLNIADKWVNLNQPAVTVSNRSASYAQLALQGPDAARLLANLMPEISDLKPYRFIWQPDNQSLISRTGYTGEDGFEIYLKPEAAPELWQSLIALGAVPAGLGARDSLRLEAGMPLYGHELAADITPLEAGLGRFADLGKSAPGFVGQSALLTAEPCRRLVGLRAQGRAIPRAGYPVLLNGREIGQVTSGGYSPCLEQGIAMALVENSAALESGTFTVLIRDREEPFTLCPMPFVSRSSTK